MSKTASIYLDFLRFFSAILVFTFHAKYARYDGAWLKGIGAYGHDAVIIFFVLSGFVIAFVASTKEHDLVDYAKSRLARLYSVVVPALVLTLALDFFGQALDPELYVGAHYQDSSPAYRLLANLFFINEIWFDSWRAFSNGPFWSMSFEFWYYVIFASWFYFTGYKKWMITFVAMLIAGPKILILLPVWLMGVMAFHASTKLIFGKFTAVALAVTPVFIYYIIREYGVQKYLLSETVEWLGRDFVYQDLKWSRRFISDWIVGGLVAIHLIGMLSLSNFVSVPNSIEKVIRYFAGMTFAFYLFHYPLLQFFASMIKQGPIIVGLTTISIILIAPWTEGKKREWRILINRIFLFVTRCINCLRIKFFNKPS